MSECWIPMAMRILQETHHIFIREQCLCANGLVFELTYRGSLMFMFLMSGDLLF